MKLFKIKFLTKDSIWDICYVEAESMGKAAVEAKRRFPTGRGFIVSKGK